ncbi:MAG: hypothetical protein M1819_003773 [Sarea resinae]|nr:MAG: hypothetical protein M1819_003773 [Sarea resinae]
MDLGVLAYIRRKLFDGGAAEKLKGGFNCFAIALAWVFAAACSSSFLQQHKSGPSFLLGLYTIRLHAGSCFDPALYCLIAFVMAFSIKLALASLSLSLPLIAAVNNTVSNSNLQTWWHDSGEINYQTAVQPGNVRQSHMYSVQVSSSSDSSDTYYDSFVYETIPRNGNGNILVPNDPSSTTDQDDGITIEADIELTMAWSEFLYASAVTVKISRLDGTISNTSDVVIRPSTLSYDISDSDGDIYINVPYSAQGSRFSVEFQDNLYSFHDSCTTPTCGYVQDSDPSGPNYTDGYTDNNPVMGIEPLDSLLIFASPFPSEDLVPDSSASSSLVVEPGLVTGLNETQQSTVIFQAGVYWFTGTAHANLSSSVNWVYFAPGSYVKGAVEFNTDAAEMKATGYGVLSGEQYVYQANPSSGYSNEQSNGNDLRMWSGVSASGQQQTFLVNGVTINAPPFNSMDFTGDLDSLSVQAWDYKQVGAFFGQTDGLEIYPGSFIRDVFYHSNDDTIKTYYSNVDVERLVIWKAHTAPIIQFGWSSRSTSNITVNEVDVIHSRWNSNGSHPSIIGSNQVYLISEDTTDTADLSNTITDTTYSNIRGEGISGNLFRICPLANFQNFNIENVTIESFPIASSGISDSELVAFTDSSGQSVSLSNFVISNFYVGDTKVSTANGNWDSTSLGNLNIASIFMSSGNVTID